MSEIHQSVVIPFKEIEPELRTQLRMMQGEGGPVQRVRMSNLVIFCTTEERVRQVQAALGDIVAIHPARILLCVGEREAPGDEITASVQVACSLVSRYQACTELVMLHAVGPAVDRLPFAVRALAIGDLPTNLWWSTPVPPPMAGIFIHDLAENAQQIVYDSIGWPEPARGVAATAAWLESVERVSTSYQWRVASDLNWRRLKFWRRLINQALDPATAQGAMETITEVQIEHGPHAVIQGWLLASWLACKFGWTVQGGRVEQGKVIDWQFTAEKRRILVKIRRLDEGPPALRKVRIACTIANEPTKFLLTVDGTSKLSIAIEDKPDMAPRTMLIPPATGAELIGRQLSDRGRDKMFRESMSVAQIMAQGLLH